MPFYDESGEAIITPKTRKQYQAPEQKHVTAKVESIAPTTIVSGTTASRRQRLEQTQEFRDIVDAPVVVKKPATIIPVSSTPPSQTQPISNEEKARIDNMVGWADRQGGGAPSISGGEPVSSGVHSSTYDKIPTEIKTGT
ncbi:MAG: hypothetical protein JRI72_03930, partial [Deltaproteobacteria bacterium]|nr:hypothetical protein [Deltaproteobacteria bacterium]